MVQHEVALPKDLIAAGDGGTFPDRSGHFLAHDLPDTLLGEIAGDSCGLPSAHAAASSLAPRGARITLLEKVAGRPPQTAAPRSP